MSPSSSVLLVSIFILCAWNAQGGPIHASCKLTWSFDSDCDVVYDKLVAQINKWKTADNCKNGGEKCLYKLGKTSKDEIQATHETPVKHYVDDLTFNFKQTGKKCTVDGYSTSETWYAILDYGTNYCNMHNLLTGAELDKLSGFKEDASDSKCTQYSSADCDKY